MDWNSFITGNSFDAYTYFGAHQDEDHMIFRTYAPHALRVTLTGEFNFWTESEMEKNSKGVFTFRSSAARFGQMYKYIIYTKDGTRREHCDPYGYETERGRGHCSIIRDMNSYTYHDSEWMKTRSLNYDRPLSIYEMHIGSWQKKRPGGWQWYNYDELAEPLILFLKRNGYTHVEFLPLGEHPADFSWGYQQTGLYSPTSRYGSCNALKFLVDHLHQEGIGVIFDFVSVHFAVDSYGLHMYDGSALFENKAIRKQKSDWGSICFDHSKPVVRSFLQSAADFWIREYHADGIRFDAVSHLILNGGKGEKGLNDAGIQFLKTMNKGLVQRHPEVMLIAEDPTVYEKVTFPVDAGGLGFTYKWDMGWSYDTLRFFDLKPANRAGQSRLLTFSTDYFRNEHYLLPLSHDIVSWNNPSLVSRMPGRLSSKLKNAKLLQLFMAVHPGKKMNFMGNESGMLKSWNGSGELEWNLLNTEAHRSFYKFTADLFCLVRKNSALYEADYTEWSTRWLCCEDNGIYAMIRHSKDHHILAVFNFSDHAQEQWFSLPHVANAELILNSEWRCYGGNVSRREKIFTLVNDGISAAMPKLSGVLIEITF